MDNGDSSEMVAENELNVNLYLSDNSTTKQERQLIDKEELISEKEIENENEKNKIHELFNDEDKSQYENMNSPQNFLEDLDLEVPSSYEVETVDFPRSPWITAKAENKTNLIVAENEEKECHNKSTHLSSNQDMSLSKDELSSSMRKKKVIPVGNDIFTDTYCEESSIDDSHTSIDDADFDTFLDSPDELDESIMERLGKEKVEPIPELTAEEERSESLMWKPCVVAGVERRIDLKVLEPYKRVVSHGGYVSGDSHKAIIIFSACYLPDRSRADYDYVMNNLFLYVVTTLDELVTDDYILIYLHGATARSCMPKFKWLKLCYQMINRKLKKNLKGLYLVHPTFWLKTLVLMTKPFISSKFSKKLFFIHSLSELYKVVKIEESCIPDRVKKYNELKELLEKN